MGYNIYSDVNTYRSCKYHTMQNTAKSMLCNKNVSFHFIYSLMRVESELDVSFPCFVFTKRLEGYCYARRFPY